MIKKYYVLTLCVAALLSACNKQQSPSVKTALPTVKPWFAKAFMGEQKQWVPVEQVANAKRGMFELTQYPDMQATEEQKRIANEFVQKTFAAAKAKGWLNKDKGLQHGFANMYKDKIHYVNKAFLYDGKVLDAEAPEFLMYYPTDKGDLLMGAMFTIEEHGPQIGGPLTLWHYHIEPGICYENNFLPVGEVNENGQCVVGNLRKKSPEMLHVWFFDHPDGRFASRMRLTPEQFELAKQQVLQEYALVK